jgi:hypothetical protein
MRFVLALLLLPLTLAACGSSTPPAPPPPPADPAKVPALGCSVPKEANFDPANPVKAVGLWSAKHSGAIDPLTQRAEEVHGGRVVTAADRYHAQWRASVGPKGGLKLSPPKGPPPAEGPRHPEAWELVLSDGTLLEVRVNGKRCEAKLARPGGRITLRPNPEAPDAKVQLVGCWITGGPHTLSAPLALALPSGKCTINALHSTVDAQGQPTLLADALDVEIPAGTQPLEVVIPPPPALAP